MIEDRVLKIINKHVDEYIDEMRFDFIYLHGNREIKEVTPGKFVVQDSDLIIDKNNQNYEEILRHPVEDFYIPEIVELFVVEFIVELGLPELEELTNFDVSGVIHQEEIQIWDERISNEDIESLLNHTCFDKNYQKFDPEVTAYLKSEYEKPHSHDVQKFLERIRPLLGV